MAVAERPSLGTEQSIEASGLVKSFQGRNGVVRAVQGVDVSIARGETVALLGPNGAGKSTTIEMLLGLLEPDSGTVSLFGRAPADSVAAGSIGVMLQTGSLIHDLSVRELVAMLASIYPSPLAVDHVLELTASSHSQTVAPKTSRAARPSALGSRSRS